jgi:hypothetical protein
LVENEKEARTCHIGGFRVTASVMQELKRIKKEQKRDSIGEIVRIAVDEYLEKIKEKTDPKD